MADSEEKAKKGGKLRKKKRSMGSSSLQGLYFDIAITRDKGNRCVSIKAKLSPREADLLRTWRQARGLTTSQAVRYLIIRTMLERRRSVLAKWHYMKRGLT